MHVLNNGDCYVNEDQYPAIPDQYNEIIQAVANRDNAHMIVLPYTIDKGRKAFYDGMHFNEWGAKAVLAAVLVRSGLLQFDEMGILHRL